MTVAAVVTPFLRTAERVLPSGRRGPWQATSQAIIPVHDNEKSYPVPVWSGLISAKHRRRMGIALWLFLWCLDRITLEKDGWGIVFRGAPVKDEVIAKQLGVHANTVRADRERLVQHKYITARRTSFGFVYQVRNSRKLEIWKKKRSTETCDSPGKGSTENCGSVQKGHTETCGSDPQKPVETKKTQQLTQQEADAAAGSRGYSVWDFLKIQPCGPASFCLELESRWVSRNGKKPSVLIGEAFNAWEADHGAKPRGCADLFRALDELRKTERRETETARRPRIATADDVIPREH